MNQIELHKKIDKLTKTGPGVKTVDFVRELISRNDDAKRYFFAVADKRWIDWLWKNGFLGAIRQKADDTSKYSYRMPELDYLAGMAEKDPKKVTDIILDTPIAKENFNQQVISQFLWICNSLPADQIARLVKKVKEEEWTRLMHKFNHWGFDYEKMMKKLSEADDYRSILILAEAVLAIRKKEEIEKDNRRYNNDNPFYFDGLGHTKIFKYLVDAGKSFSEETLSLVVNKTKEIIMLSDHKDENKVFGIEENFYLFDVDFFKLEIESERHISFRDDVKNLVAVIKKLAENEIGSCDNPEKIKELYEKYINTLPFSRSMWRLRLFVLSLCPEIFKQELKKAFFKPLQLQYELHYHELLSGTEYYKALKKGFYVLLEKDKRTYIKDVINFFSKTIDDKDVEKWRKRDGLRILSCIEKELDVKEKEKAEKVLDDKINKDFKPEPSIGSMRGGTVRPMPPVDLDALSQMSISEIVKNLTDEWTPENLHRMDKNKDFLRPLNAEGMGEILKKDMENRPDLYLDEANLFFNRDKLDSHYTYSFLRGMYDIFKQGKFPIKKADKLFELFNSIADSGREKEFSEKRDKKEKFDAWLASWTGVHNVITDNLKVILDGNNENSLLDFENKRSDLLKIIKYLLSCSDPKFEDNVEEHDSDPFAIAINSVRGQAFEVLTLFIYLDGKKFSKEAEVKINKDIKKIYEEVLDKEDTLAVMFLFGHYLPSFYYRDKKWVMRLVDKVFPKSEDKRDLFFAALEGYLSANLYGELFEELQDLYKLAINFKPEEYTKRKYFKELDEGLAIHMALAFIYFDDFSSDSELFKMFWETPNKKRQQKFISFIGQHAISRDDAVQFAKDGHINVKKIKDFWDWALKNDNIKENKSFEYFGNWMKYQEDLFDPKWLAEHIYKTFKRSHGKIDWDYGMVKSIVLLADKAPEETLKILQNYLLNQARLDPSLATVYIDDFMEAMRILYKNEKTKKEVYNLVDELIKIGSSRFWVLKEIVK